MRRLDLLLAIVMLFALPISAACDHRFVQREQPPRCDRPGMRWLECTLCGFTTEFAELPKLDHVYGDWYWLQLPTCGRDGFEARDCTQCGGMDQRRVPATGHSYVLEVVPPTCTAHGYTSHYCTNCSDRFRTDSVSPLGHCYDGGVITKEPTPTAMGRVTYTCIRCGDTRVETIPKLSNPFKDIVEGEFYYIPVLWAVSSGITTGMDETHFGPEELCTRSQVAVFLWRLAGKPEPLTDTNPFLDVIPGSYYEKAVLWAYERGITTGINASHFGPEEPCDRAQVVTFLHRYHGCPKPGISHVFPDVAPSDYYCEAVLWAAQRGITVGMDGGRFCPLDACSRSQIVTFLYRDAKNP